MTCHTPSLSHSRRVLLLKLFYRFKRVLHANGFMLIIIYEGEVMMVLLGVGYTFQECIIHPKLSSSTSPTFMMLDVNPFACNTLLCV